jgi:hypothetical protein
MSLDHWVELEVSGVLDAPGTRVRVTDHLRSQQILPWLPLKREQAEWLAELLRRLCAGLPSTAALPVFVRVPPALANRWADITRTLLRAAPGELRLQPVQLPQGERPARRPFRLPLNLYALHGPASRILAAPVLDSLLADNNRSPHGLQVVELRELPSPEWLRERKPDLLLGTERQLLVLRSRLLGVPLEDRPRLLVALRPWQSDQQQPEPLAGTSLLWFALGAEEGATFLGAFLRALLDDSSLSDAFFAATGHAPLSLEQARLLSDPECNQSLRMSSALQEVLDSALTLTAQWPLASMEPSKGMAPWKRALFERADEAVRTAFSLPAHLRGPDALRFLSFSLDTLDEARQQLHLEAEQRTEAPHQETEQARHERRVDLRLERTEDSPLLAAQLSAAEARWVGPRVVLRRGATYRLRLQIGFPLSGSLFESLPPPIDPLLSPPTAAGHELQAVLYPLDFELLGPETQSLLLPFTGASEPVFFGVRAPERTGPARMRAIIYRRNHLVQSFVISAEIADEEHEREETVLRAALEFARSTTFLNLDALGPRALSIGVNESPGGATHTVMVKGTQAGSVHLTEALLSEQVARFREILLRASVKENNQPRFPDFPPPGQPPLADFHDVVRQLADWGGQMFQALFSRASAPLQQTLRGLTQSSDAIIQIVRHDPNFAFPWAALYDFCLPERLQGDPPPPVCTGFIPMPQGEKPCGHSRADKAYCARGFWGVRHRVEQLLGVTVEDAMPEFSVPPECPRVQLAVGTSDNFTTRLSDQLRERFGSALRVMSADDHLLDLLWKEEQRPAEVILLGHLETRPLSGEPLGARLVLPTRDRWLRAKTLTDRVIDEKKWDTPRPIVFLMACSAASTQLATPSDLLIALTTAGAVAVIGTECVIFTGMAARCALELTEAFWAQQPLGAAVSSFRRQLMKEGNPLGFAFTAYGDAELTLKGKA